MESLLIEHPDWVEYKEHKFGISLLYWTLYNSPRKYDEYFYDEAALLIKYGSNPYSADDSNKTPLMCAADVHKGNVKYIKLCLKSKFTNELSEVELKDKLIEALLVATGKLWDDPEGVKLLVEAGADVNYNDSIITPIYNSIVHDNILTTKYLIIEKKVNYNVYRKRDDGVKILVLNILKNMDYSNEPEKLKVWKEIIQYIDSVEIVKKLRH